MKCDRAYFVVRKANLKTIAFTRRFGASVTGEDDSDLFMAITREAYLDVRRQLEAQGLVRPLESMSLAIEEDADRASAGGAEAV
jgi:hypothetical protein